MYRFEYSNVGSREEAEDISSDVFLKAVRGIDSRRSPGSMRKWVLQIARTTLVDYWRARFQKGGSTISLEELVRAGWEVSAEEERGRRQSNAVARAQSRRRGAKSAWERPRRLIMTEREM